MNIIVLIGAVFKMIFLILETKLEKDKELKKKKEGILEDISDGIKRKDASSISISFDRINKLR